MKTEKEEIDRLIERALRPRRKRNFTTSLTSKVYQKW